MQRPLLRPAQAPAYEEQQRKKRENILEEKRQLRELDARRAAEKAEQKESEPVQ